MVGIAVVGHGVHVYANGQDGTVAVNELPIQSVLLQTLLVQH